MWKNITLHTTTGSGRLPDSNDRSTGNQEWQHRRKELRSIQFTITRRSRASAFCANQNTQGTNQAELQQRHFTGTSTHALGSSTQCIHHEQIGNPQQWMHKLLQQIELRARYTASQVWRDSAVHATNTKTRAEVLQRDIWLGKDTTMGECLIGTYSKIVRARTIRRQIMPRKDNQQLLDCVHTGPWKTPASALPTPTLKTPVTMPATSKALTSQKDSATSAAADGKRQSASQSSDQRTKQKKTAQPTSPMATSPTHQKGPALPAPPPTSHRRKR